MLPDWLSSWWNFWAGVTDLFDWDALYVFFVVLGGVWALANWSNSNRIKRRKDANVIQRSAIPIKVISKSLTAILSESVKNNSYKSALRGWLRSGILDQQIEFLKRSNTESVSSLLCSEFLTASLAQMEGIRYFVSVISENDDEEILKECLKASIECNKYLLYYNWRIEREIEKISGKLELVDIDNSVDVFEQMEIYEKSKNSRKSKYLFGKIRLIFPR